MVCDLVIVVMGRRSMNTLGKYCCKGGGGGCVIVGVTVMMCVCYPGSNGGVCVCVYGNGSSGCRVVRACMW